MASEPGARRRALDPERGGAAGQPLDQQLEADQPGQDQLGVDRGEGGLEPGHAHRRLLEGDLLFLRLVRRVVGGDALDRAVAEAGDQRLAVGLGAQRRVHLEALRVEAADLLVGQAEVVRAGLGADLDPGRLGGGDRLDRLGGGEVLDVDAGVLVAGEGGVAGDHRRLRDAGDAGQPERGRDRALVHDAVAGEVGVLLVEGDVAAAEALVLEGAAHDAGAADRQAVVGEADRAGFAQFDHLGQLLAPHPLVTVARKPTGTEAPARACSRRALTSAAVETGGCGVGHREDAAVAAGGGGAGAGLDVLLVLLAGGAQVDVGVEEGGEGVQALGLDHLGPLGRGRGAGRGELGDRGRRGRRGRATPSIPATGSRTVALRQDQAAASGAGPRTSSRSVSAHAGCPIAGLAVGTAPSASLGAGARRSAPARSS